MNKNHAQYVKFLVEKNYPLVINSAIAHCHCLGLNSFIISQDPKIRLFIADDHSEIHDNPGIIPIHSHKYDDYFQVIEGGVTHRIFNFKFDGKPFQSYTYQRIGDREDEEPVAMGQSYLKVVDILAQDEVILKSKLLHNVKLTGRNVMWTVTEMQKSQSFNQICYDEGTLKRRPELYKKVNDPMGFIDYKLNSVLNSK